MATDLTLLLPTKDRPQFFSRWVNWAIAEDCPFPIVVADGSSVENSRVMEFQAKRGSRNGLNMVYLQFPPDAQYSDYLKKMRQAINAVQTPNLALVCDDDFYDFDNLEKLDRFLASNADYAAVQGEVIDFYLLPDNPLRRVRGKPIEKGVPVSTRRGRYNSGRQSSSRTVDDESIVARWNSLGHAWPRESIMRVEVAAETYRIAQESRVDTYRQELPILRLVCLALGKLAAADFAVVFRQNNVAGSAGDLMIQQHATLSDYARSPGAAQVEQLMAQKLLKLALTRRRGQDRELPLELIRATLETRLRGQCSATNIVGASRCEGWSLLVFQIWRRLSRRLRSSGRGPIADAIQISKVVRERFSEGFISRLQAYMKTRS